ncbi:procathepsin L-like [Sitodiplosis mosellana]|uniref:procathepsin L-like n=1 Tax=Sitodiplosis mosellana TaxID=263140 RepID=UPI00244453D5|nr:procathepsin L-like [Sitodiplosis mosellana]
MFKYTQAACIICLVVINAFLFTFAVNDIENEWNRFKLKYSKEYKSDAEDLFRMNIFKENQQKIAQHNVAFDKGEVPFKTALNKFADWTNDEFVQISGRVDTSDQTAPKDTNNDVNKTIIDSTVFVSPANVIIPPSVDWREKGAVNEIKDQGRCGSCWAFAASAALESHHFIKTGQLVSLSEQNIIDCSTEYGTHGCNGGFRYYAFQYVKDNGGIESEESYPYEGTDNNTCRYNPKNSVTTDHGVVDIPEGDETALVAALATVGPVSVSIDATHYSFRFYSTGVYFEPECLSQNVNGHAVLAIGYGTDENGQDYYLIKNSWSTSWGNAGYFKLARNKNNHCAIASAAYYPL